MARELNDLVLATAKPPKLLKVAATVSRLARNRFARHCTAASLAYSDLRAVEEGSPEFLVLKFAQDFALANLNGVESATIAAAGTMEDPKSGFPAVFMARPASDMAARAWSICDPSLTLKQKSDSAANQLRSSIVSKEAVGSFLETLGRDRAGLDATNADLMKSLGTYQEAAGKSEARSIDVVRDELFASEHILEMVAELLEVGSYRLDPDLLLQVSKGRSRINHQMVHNDPIFIMNLVDSVEPDGLSPSIQAGIAAQSFEYLLMASLSVNRYFGWDDLLFRDWMRDLTARLYTSRADTLADFEARDGVQL